MEEKKNNERSILFQEMMVNSIDRDMKTMTRRSIKQVFHPDTTSLRPMKYPHENIFMPFDKMDRITGQGIKFPYGNIGDFLWVRETFYAYGWWIEEGVTNTGKPKKRFVDFTLIDKEGYKYKDRKPDTIIQGMPLKVMGWYQRPSLFMPKEASRFSLKITGRKAERLREISEEDAIREGVGFQGCGAEKFYMNYNPLTRLFEYEFAMARDSFETLWKSINGEGSWKANNFVFAISFEKYTKIINGKD